MNCNSRLPKKLPYRLLTVLFPPCQSRVRALQSVSKSEPFDVGLYCRENNSIARITSFYFELNVRKWKAKEAEPKWESGAGRRYTISSVLASHQNLKKCTDINFPSTAKPVVDR